MSGQGRGRPLTKQEVLSQQQKELTEKRKEEESRRAEEEERRKDAEKRRQQDEERRQKLEEQRAIEDELRRFQEEEARAKALEEEANRPKSLQELIKEKEDAKKRKKEESKAIWKRPSAVTGTMGLAETAEVSSEVEQLPDVQAPQAFDLLGGLSDVEEHVPVPSSSVPHTRDVLQVNNAFEDVSISHVEDGTDFGSMIATESSAKKTHRAAAQRGRLDELVDTFFDRRNAIVPVIKQGREDGVYRFGQRIMRVRQEGQELIAYSGTQRKNGLRLAEFVATYEGVEARKLDALRAAGAMVSFFSAGSKAVA